MSDVLPRPARRITRREAASRITSNHFPIKERTLERWDDLEGIIVCGRFLTTVEAVDAAALRRIRAAEEKAELKRSEPEQPPETINGTATELGLHSPGDDGGRSQ
jgi:hypothetical protein